MVSISFTLGRLNADNNRMSCLEDCLLIPFDSVAVSLYVNSNKTKRAIQLKNNFSIKRGTNTVPFCFSLRKPITKHDHFRLIFPLLIVLGKCYGTQ